MGEREAPALPGEVWRSVVRVRPVESEIDALCAIAPSPEPWAPGDTTMRAWRWLDHADTLPVLGKWREMFGEAVGVFRAAFMAERAAREKAEADRGVYFRGLADQVEVLQVEVLQDELRLQTTRSERAEALAKAERAYRVAALAEAHAVASARAIGTREAWAAAAEAHAKREDALSALIDAGGEP